MKAGWAKACARPQGALKEMGRFRRVSQSGSQDLWMVASKKDADRSAIDVSTSLVSVRQTLAASDLKSPQQAAGKSLALKPQNRQASAISATAAAALGEHSRTAASWRQLMAADAASQRWPGQALNNYDRAGEQEAAEATKMALSRQPAIS